MPERADPTKPTPAALYEQATALWQELRIGKDLTKRMAIAHSRGEFASDAAYVEASGNVRAIVRQRTLPLVDQLRDAIERHVAGESVDDTIEKTVRSPLSEAVRLGYSVGGKKQLLVAAVLPSPSLEVIKRSTKADKP